MTALKGKDIKAFIAKRDASKIAVLIYGDDAGAVRERSDMLARQVVPDLTDPFNFIELTENDLRGDPARLSDEAAALSMMGGERVIRIRGGDASILSACKLLINGLDSNSLKSNALILVETGSLLPASALRKLFEKSNHCVTLPCYQDGAADLAGLVKAMLAEEGLSIEPDGLQMMLEGFSQDRALNRAEINKLILYMGPASIRKNGDNKKITLGDIRACFADHGGNAMMEIAALVASGDRARLAHTLSQARQAGASPLAWLRLTQRMFMRLAQLNALMDSGANSREAMAKLRPPMRYPESTRVEPLLRKWNSPALENALGLLLQADLAAKQTGAPALEISERTALRLCVMAAGKR